MKPKLLAAGAIAPIPAAQARYVSSTYLLPKKAPGEFRQIVDLRPINKYCVIPACKFETLSILADLARSDDVSFAADL